MHYNICHNDISTISDIIIIKYQRSRGPESGIRSQKRKDYINTIEMHQVVELKTLHIVKILSYRLL